MTELTEHTVELALVEHLREYVLGCQCWDLGKMEVVDTTDDPDPMLAHCPILSVESNRRAPENRVLRAPRMFLPLWSLKILVKGEICMAIGYYHNVPRQWVGAYLVDPDAVSEVKRAITKWFSLTNGLTESSFDVTNVMLKWRDGFKRTGIN